MRDYQAAGGQAQPEATKCVIAFKMLPANTNESLLTSLALCNRYEDIKHKLRTNITFLLDFAGNPGSLNVVETLEEMEARYLALEQEDEYDDRREDAVAYSSNRASARPR